MGSLKGWGAVTKVTWDTARSILAGDTGMSNRTDGANFASQADMSGQTTRARSTCTSYRATRSNGAKDTAWVNSTT